MTVRSCCSTEAVATATLWQSSRVERQFSMYSMSSLRYVHNNRSVRKLTFTEPPELLPAGFLSVGLRRAWVHGSSVGQARAGARAYGHVASKLELANLEQTERHFATAESLYREILVVQERVLGADHPDSLATRASLATMMSAAGRFDEAERLWRDALARMQRSLGPTHPDTANCFTGLAAIELHRGRPDAALRLLQQTVRVDPAWGPRIAVDPEFAKLKGNAAFETLTATTPRK